MPIGDIEMDTGKFLMLTGLGLTTLGLAIKYTPWLLNWFGHLPGDIRIESEHSRVFFPITSMIVVSVLLSIIVNLLRK